VDVEFADLAGIFGADLALEFDPSAVQVLSVESLVPESQGLVASRVDGKSILIAAALANGRGAGKVARIKLAPLSGASAICTLPPSLPNSPARSQAPTIKAPPTTNARFSPVTNMLFDMEPL